MRLRAVLLTVVMLGCRDAGDARIGVVLSNDGIDAAVMAVEDARTQGGPKLTIRSIPESFGAAMPAITAAETLAADESVVGVVGHSNSASTLSASTIYNEKGLSHIAPTSTVALLDDAGPFSFRMVGSDAHQAEFLAKAVSNHPNARMAVMFVNDDYGRGLHETLEGLLRRDGRSIVYEAPYAEGAKFGDPEGNARAISLSRPDILFWLGRSQELARVLPILRRTIPNAIVVASDGVQDQIADDTVATFAGLQFVRVGPVAPDSSRIEALAHRFRERFGYALTTQALLTYEAAMLYAAAIRTVGPDRQAVRNFLASLGRGRPRHAGVTGAVAFDSTGAAGSSYSLMSVAADGTMHPAPYPIP